MRQKTKTQSNSIERRIKARELAFQALFQYDFRSKEGKAMIDLFLRSESQDDLTESLARQWAYGAIDHLDQCDQMLSKVMKRWSPSALMPIERAILRLSVYQLLQCSNIPGKVIINEAIELAKKFSTENSPGFVNGILDAVLKKISEGEDSAAIAQPEIINDKAEV